MSLQLALDAPAIETRGPAPLVIGVDASLTSTGIAGADWTANIRPTNRGEQRLADLVAGVGDYLKNADMVVFEGPSYGHAAMAGHEDLAGLRVLLRMWCWRRKIPYAVAPPSNVKLYATGRGNAAKGQIRTALIERYGISLEGRARYDEADAACLAYMGLHWLGHPVADVPERNASALDGCQWPEEVLAA